MSAGKITTHGLPAVHATLVEVRRDGTPIGRVCRDSGYRTWYWRPLDDGASLFGPPRDHAGWNGPYKLIRDAVAAVAAVAAAVPAEGEGVAC